MTEHAPTPHADATPVGPLVITGLSGSGKTLISRSLEDLGYHCVDNIPLDLLEELFASQEATKKKLVVVVDVRAPGFTERFPAVYERLAAANPELRLLFVEAAPEVLLRRFSVARRPHPLGGSLEEAIEDEHASLADIRRLADILLDTSHLNPHELRRHAASLAGVDDPKELMTVDVESFSYLYGVPEVASVVFDVRFLPNPHFEESLRQHPGDDPRVSAWLSDFSEVEEALDKLITLVSYLLPRYAEELKTHVTIAVGCTGGRHRSVYVACEIAQRIAERGYQVRLHHRDKERWRN